MHRICLVRHAKAEQTDGIPDDHRYLTPVGRKHAEELGTILEGESRQVGLVISSPVLRAKQTATIVALRSASQLLIDQRLSTRAGPDDALEAIAEYLPEVGERTLVVVGHNPTITELAQRLTLGGCQGVRTCQCIDLEFEQGQFPGIARLNRTLYTPDE